MVLSKIGKIKTDLFYEPTFIRVPFCKSNFMLTFIKYAQPRELGKLSENLVDSIYDFAKPDNNEYDFYWNGDRIEIKSSRAYSHVGDRSMCSIENLYSDDLYDCNIQHVKKKLFDWLFYVIYCDDGLQIFKIKSEDINIRNVGYSDKQQRHHSGNGQFHVHNNNYVKHLSYLVQELRYEQAYDLLKASDGFV